MSESKTGHQSEEDLTCPICLSAAHEASDSLFFCKSPCGHIFCVPCLEHFLLKPKSVDYHRRFGQLNNEDDYYYHRRPNTGNCPLCRRTINLFDLMNIKENSAVYTKNSSITTWPICDKRYSKQSLRQPSSTELQLLKRLAEEEGAISGYGLEFDFNSSNPRIRFSSDLLAPQVDGQDFSDSESPTLVQLDSQPWESYHFFAKTMTFQGNIQFPNFVTRVRVGVGDYRYDQLECLLQFSDSGHFVRDGYLRWKLQSTTSAASNSQDTSEHFALDGTWQVMWTSGQTLKIHVQRHCFDCMQQWYKIEMDESHRPRFEWPGEDVIQNSDQSIPPGEQGPAVGGVIEWKTNSSMAAYDRIIWKRLGMDLTDAWKLSRLEPERFVFRRILSVEETGGNDDALLARPAYHADGLWGNTFCQAFCVGLASYHFVGTNDETGELEAYISYEHPSTSSWPPLDNGSAVPSRVPFRNISFDPSTRTFRGDICWLEGYGTRWQGEAKWAYELQFDQQFLFVEGGMCQRSEGLPHHQFGVDLVYVNAAIEDPLRESIRVDGGSANYESASEATKSMIRILVVNAVQNRESSLFDFNL